MTRRRAHPFATALAIGGSLIAACGRKGTPAGAPASSSTTQEAVDAPAAVSFDTTLELLGVSFHVTSSGRGSVGQVTITPTGLEIDNSSMTDEIDGQVTGAEVADLNVDQSPEIYVYVASAGSGSYGSLVAYSTNRKKSLSAIYLPPLSENAEASVGYMGHDSFAVVENTLVRRFPVYKETDTNASPTGGTRQVQYKLRRGEAGWVLRADKVVSY